MPRVHSSLRQVYLVAPADDPGSVGPFVLTTAKSMEASQHPAGPAILLCCHHAKGLRLHGEYTDSSTSRFCGSL